MHNPTQDGAVVETPSIYLDMTAQENLKEQYRIWSAVFDTIPELLRLVDQDTGKRQKNSFPGMQLTCDWESQLHWRGSGFFWYWMNRLMGLDRRGSSDAGADSKAEPGAADYRFDFQPYSG